MSEHNCKREPIDILIAGVINFGTYVFMLVGGLCIGRLIAHALGMP